MFLKHKLQYEMSSALMTEPVRRSLLALLYISRTSINISGAVTSLHIILTKPAKDITIFLLSLKIVSDSYDSLLTP